MGVGTWTILNAGTMTGTQYKEGIDNNSLVIKRLAAAFAPHEQSTPNMTVRVDSGWIWDGTTLTEVAAQNTPTITAPTTNPRIDRVVKDPATGAISVVTGTEATSPSPPAIPSGKEPICQIYLTPGMTAITNDRIVDERVVGGGVGGSNITLRIFTSSGTWVKPTGVKKIFVEVYGGGGGGASLSNNGGNGGTSSFGSYCSATGGGGGTSMLRGSGGSGSGGDINRTGQSCSWYSLFDSATPAYSGCDGGSQPAGTAGGWGGRGSNGSGESGGLFGGGGASAGCSGSSPPRFGGGAGGYSCKLIDVSGVSSVAVTVGAGGAGGGGSPTGGAGAQGGVIVWEFY